jgi:hypothetical protein
MPGKQVFEQIVTQTEQPDKLRHPVNYSDYDQWRKDYIWEALHGIRYGQSFCNHFGVTDNLLYYGSADIQWCDEYIKKTYLARN